MILVFGTTGQVGSELRLMKDVICLSRAEADLAYPDACSAAILAYKPTAVINAAAYTAVDKCEDEEEAAHVINGLAPAAMAKACARLSIPIVHISTDYVFDGRGVKPFAVTDIPSPLGAYGRTKLYGEQGVIESGAVFAILRTSWVFSEHGNNFVKTMLRLGATRRAVNVVNDQRGGPTSARAIANAAMVMAIGLQSEPEKKGVYHLSGATDVSWAEFARKIFSIACMNVAVKEIPSTDYPTPAKRPLNSCLDCTELTKFDLERPDWISDLTDVLKKLRA